jgi:hypothetical protein
MKPEPSNSKPDCELDREISALLGVEPSPQFVSRVRTRIASSPAPSLWHFGWTLPAAAAMAAVIVLAVVISRPHETTQPDVKKSLPATVSNTNDPGLPVKLPSTSKPATPPAGISTPQHAVSTEPEMLVSPREAWAIQRLLNGGAIRPWVEITEVTLEPQPLPETRIMPIPVIELTSIEPSLLVSEKKGDLQ